MKYKILIVIPARGGSKGIKNKNIINLNDHPLISYSILTSLGVNNVDKVIVSTENLKIASIAKKYGAEVPFIRPDYLAKDNVTLVHVIRHALEFFDSIGERFDAILSIQPTAPLLLSSTIEKMVDIFIDTGCESVATISEIKHGHPYLAKRIVGDTVENFCDCFNNITKYPRQVREPAFYFNGCAFLRRRDVILNMDESTNCLGNFPRFVKIDEFESINIDNRFDLEIVSNILL